MQRAETDVAAEEEMGLINAFGMYWSRSDVFWEAGQVSLLGEQQAGSEPVDFREQAGIYLLYDGNKIVYVGRVTEPRMGARLREHTRDRHKSRWDRFSWFGVRSVDDPGRLAPVCTESISIKTLIATMEALLIEGLEPPQNRRQDDGFNAVEFTQMTDPKVEMQLQQNMLDQLQRKLRN
ncbi:GIY-YIG nuclease family protein [Rhodococcoides kroppenstedtii]|uniref:GIY-YIG nuclease family protein n=1 Tax=Rhodococcoides kroppenstedtii TaxID=293050 RepID=UPI00362E8040